MSKIYDVVRGRRTIRLFQQKSVQKQDLRAMLDGARVTCSGGNQQPLRYLVIQNPTLAEKVFAQTAWAYLVRPHRTPVWGVHAPQTFIAVLGPGDSAPLLHANAGAAIQSMQLIACERGLGCCWLGAIQRETLHELLQLPSGQEVVYLLAVGYPAEEPLMEDVSERESHAYYVDGENRLHVPKLCLEDVVQWQ